MPRPQYPAPGRPETGLGRAVRRIPLPYGLNMIPQITHQIMGGVRYRQGQDARRNMSGAGGLVRRATTGRIRSSLTQPQLPSGSGPAEPSVNPELPQSGPQSGGNFRYEVGLRPDDPDYPGYDEPSTEPYGEPTVEPNPVEESVSDQVERLRRDENQSQPPAQGTQPFQPNPQRGLGIILQQYPSLNSPATIRALMNGASVQQLMGRSQFDSRAAGQQLMEAMAYGGNVNDPGTTSDEGQSRFYGQAMQLNEHGGYEPLGLTRGAEYGIGTAPMNQTSGQVDRPAQNGEAWGPAASRAWRAYTRQRGFR